jgi:hypothetical protein
LQHAPTDCDSERHQQQKTHNAWAEQIRLEEKATTEPPTVLVAEAQDQSATPFSCFTLFAAFLAACVSGGWAAACALGSAGRGVLTPDRKDIKNFIFLIVLFCAIEYAKGCGVNHPRVSTGTYQEFTSNRLSRVQF